MKFVDMMLWNIAEYIKEKFPGQELISVWVFHYGNSSDTSMPLLDMMERVEFPEDMLFRDPIATYKNPLTLEEAMVAARLQVRRVSLADLDPKAFEVWTTFLDWLLRFSMDPHPCEADYCTRIFFNFFDCCFPEGIDTDRVAACVDFAEGDPEKAKEQFAAMYGHFFQLEPKQWRYGLEHFDCPCAAHADWLFGILDWNDSGILDYEEIAILIPELKRLRIMAKKADDFAAELAKNRAKDAMSPGIVQVMSRFEFKMANLRKQNKRKRDAAEQLEKFIMQKYGHKMRAWLEIDNDRSMQVSRIEFMKWCAAVGFLGDRRAAWSYYDKDESGDLSVDEWSLDASIGMGQFQAWFRHRFCCQTELVLNLFRWENRKVGHLTEKQFVEILIRMDFRPILSIAGIFPPLIELATEMLKKRAARGSIHNVDMAADAWTSRRYRVADHLEQVMSQYNTSEEGKKAAEQHEQEKKKGGSSLLNAMKSKGLMNKKSGGGEGAGLSGAVSGLISGAKKGASSSSAGAVVSAAKNNKEKDSKTAESSEETSQKASSAGSEGGSRPQSASAAGRSERTSEQKANDDDDETEALLAAAMSKPSSHAPTVLTDKAAVDEAVKAEKSAATKNKSGRGAGSTGREGSHASAEGEEVAERPAADVTVLEEQGEEGEKENVVETSAEVAEQDPLAAPVEEITHVVEEQDEAQVGEKEDDEPDEAAPEQEAVGETSPAVADEDAQQVDAGTTPQVEAGPEGEADVAPAGPAVVPEVSEQPATCSEAAAEEAQRDEQQVTEEEEGTVATSQHAAASEEPQELKPEEESAVLAADESIPAPEEPAEAAGAVDTEAASTPVDATEAAPAETADTDGDEAAPAVDAGAKVAADVLVEETAAPADAQEEQAGEDQPEPEEKAPSKAMFGRRQTVSFDTDEKVAPTEVREYQVSGSERVSDVTVKIQGARIFDSDEEEAQRKALEEVGPADGQNCLGAAAGTDKEKTSEDSSEVAVTAEGESQAAEQVKDEGAEEKSPKSSSMSPKSKKGKKKGSQTESRSLVDSSFDAGMQEHLAEAELAATKVQAQIRGRRDRRRANQIKEEKKKIKGGKGEPTTTVAASVGLSGDYVSPFALGGAGTMVDPVATPPNSEQTHKAPLPVVPDAQVAQVVRSGKELWAKLQTARCSGILKGPVEYRKLNATNRGVAALLKAAWKKEVERADKELAGITKLKNLSSGRKLLFWAPRYEDAGREVDGDKLVYEMHREVAEIVIQHSNLPDEFPDEEAEQREIQRLTAELLAFSSPFTVYLEQRKKFFCELFFSVGADAKGDRFLYPHDLHWLKYWTPRPWLVSLPNFEDAEDLKACLREENFGNDLAVWKAMDADASNKVTWPEIEESLNAIRWPDCDRRLPGAWRALDTHRRGFITLHDFSPKTVELLQPFFQWVHSRFRSYEAAMKFLEGGIPQGRKDMGLLEFREQLRLGGWTANCSELLQLLDLDGGGTVTPSEIMFLEVFDNSEDLADSTPTDELEEMKKALRLQKLRETDFDPNFDNRFCYVSDHEQHCAEVLSMQTKPTREDIIKMNKPKKYVIPTNNPMSKLQSLNHPLYKPLIPWWEVPGLEYGSLYSHETRFGKAPLPHHPLKPKYLYPQPEEYEVERRFWREKPVMLDPISDQMWHPTLQFGWSRQHGHNMKPNPEK